MDVFNLNGDEWDSTEEREGWRSKAALVGARLNAELIGGGMYELEPGNTLWPVPHAPRERGVAPRRARAADAALTRGRA